MKSTAIKIAIVAAVIGALYLIWRFILPQNLIAKLESFAAKPYPDGKGYSTGYGHQILPNEQYLMTAVLTQAQAQSMLSSDITNRYAPPVDALIRGLGYNPAQRAALISFHYNTGAISHLASFIKARDFAGLVAKMREYRIYKGAVNAGLVSRREQEAAPFIGVSV